jgi:HEPN domain-containing protein
MSAAEAADKWFKKAEDDLRIAKRAFVDMQPKLLGISCFHCQQARG